MEPQTEGPNASSEPAESHSAKDKVRDLSEKAKANISEAKAKARDSMTSARSSASSAYDKTRDKSAQLYERGKTKAEAGYASTRKAASDAKAKTAKQVQSTPFAVVTGGLVFGALIAALVPETTREKKVMGSTGRKINGRAKQAALAAKDRGAQKVDELGLTTDALKEQLEDFVSKGVEILKTAGKAAGKSVAKKD